MRIIGWSFCLSFSTLLASATVEGVIITNYYDDPPYKESHYVPNNTYYNRQPFYSRNPYYILPPPKRQTQTSPYWENSRKQLDEFYPSSTGDDPSEPHWYDNAPGYNYRS